MMVNSLSQKIKKDKELIQQSKIEAFLQNSMPTLVNSLGTKLAHLLTYIGRTLKGIAYNYTIHS